MPEVEPNQKRPRGERDLGCDEVAWLLDIFDRYLPKDDFPRISRQREMKKYGMLYEVMEVARLTFQDESALHNGTPHEARNYQITDKHNHQRGE